MKFIIFIWIIVGTSWIVNGYKLTQCDFDTPLKCEIVHGIGLFGPASLFTVWFGTDE